MISTLDDDVTRTLLIAHGTTFLFRQTTSSSSSLKQKLELVFSHPFILPYLTNHVEGEKEREQSDSFRARFLSSLCLSMEKLLDDTVSKINYSITDNSTTENKENKDHKENKEDKDALLLALADLLNLLSAIILVINTFGR